MTVLKAFVDSLEGVDEKLHSLYVESDNGFKLEKIEGLVSKTDHDVFRNNNISLKKTIETLNSEIEVKSDIDPEVYAETLAKLEKLEEEGLKGKGTDEDIEELIARRTKRMGIEHKKQVDKQNNALTEKDTQIDSLKQVLARSMIRSEIVNEINRFSTIEEGALPDVIQRAEDVWKIKEKEDGSYGVLPIDTEGNTWYGEDGRTVLTAKEFAKELFEQAPHLFKPSAGGGAGGGKHTKPGGGRSMPYSAIKGGSAPLEKIASGEIVLEH